jgi:hypothetical protein
VVTNAEPRATEVHGCEHLIRVRDSQWGFASAETICAACGDVFDAEREQQLRERDHVLPHELPMSERESSGTHG